MGNGTLTGIRYRDEIFGPTVRPHPGAVGPGFHLVSNNAQPHVVGVCRLFLEIEGIDTNDCTPTLARPKSNRTPLELYVLGRPTLPGCTSDCSGLSKWSLLHHFSTLIFGMSEFSLLYSRFIIFISIKWCGILSFHITQSNVSINIQHDFSNVSFTSQTYH